MVWLMPRRTGGRGEGGERETLGGNEREAEEEEEEQRHGGV